MEVVKKLKFFDPPIFKLVHIGSKQFPSLSHFVEDSNILCYKDDKPSYRQNTNKIGPTFPWSLKYKIDEWLQKAFSHSRESNNDRISYQHGQRWCSSCAERVGKVPDWFHTSGIWD